jgi:hypothetical protein
MAQFDKIASMRDNSREKLYDKLEELSGGTFNVEDAKTKANTYHSFNAADGKARQQIQSYNTFMKHDANFATALQPFIEGRGGNTPKWVDMPLNYIEQYVGSDPDILELKARLIPVKNEFMTFMKNNKAALQEDVDEMNKLADPALSPRQLLRLAQTLGETGMDRLDTLNSTYKQTFKDKDGNPTNYSNLFDHNGQEAAAKLGMGNRLREYGITPPASGKSLSDVPVGKVPIYDKHSQLAGYADNKQGANYKPF